jgi:hypothetical protein
MYHAMKNYKGVEVYLHVFVTSALDGSEWSSSRVGRFTPTKETSVPNEYEAECVPEPV